MDIVDLGDRIIARVRGNCYRTKDGMVRKDTVKTDAGYRDVEIFPAFHNDVRYHLEHFVGDKPDAMLFTTATGAIVLDTSYRSILNRAKKRAGYENMPLTPHYGRNFIITTLAEASMPIPAIGEILGQRDTRTITEVYMRATEERKASVLAAVNGTFKVLMVLQTWTPSARKISERSVSNDYDTLDNCDPKRNNCLLGLVEVSKGGE